MHYSTNSDLELKLILSTLLSPSFRMSVSRVSEILVFIIGVYKNINLKGNTRYYSWFI